MSMGNLYWRSFTHWLGGMGVLVFVLAIGRGREKEGYTMHLLRAESPGPKVEGYHEDFIFSLYFSDYFECDFPAGGQDAAV